LFKSDIQYWISCSNFDGKKNKVCLYILNKALLLIYKFIFAMKLLQICREKLFKQLAMYGERERERERESDASKLDTLKRIDDALSLRQARRAFFSGGHTFAGTMHVH
jgi:hypothetical protein